MKLREIFTVSVRAYYPREENGVNWKYLLKTGCCLLPERGERKKTVFPLFHPSSKISNSEVSVEGSNINNLGINGQFTTIPMLCVFSRSVLHMVHCLITLVCSVAFKVQLIRHILLFKVEKKTQRSGWFTLPTKKKAPCLMHIPCFRHHFPQQTSVQIIPSLGPALSWSKT